MTTLPETERHPVFQQNFGDAARAVGSPKNEATAEQVGALDVRGARPLNYNHFKIPLMENA